MAILTDKGAPENKITVHLVGSQGNGYRGLGHAFCDGSDPTWGSGEQKPRPMLSELRLARLLTARGEMREKLLERVARSLAVKKPAGAQINCTDLAYFLLHPEDPKHTRKLARDYYARLDRAGLSQGEATDVDATGEAA